MSLSNVYNVGTIEMNKSVKLVSMSYLLNTISTIHHASKGGTGSSYRSKGISSVSNNSNISVNTFNIRLPLCPH